MLVYFHYLDKNPGWVTYGSGYDDYLEDYQTCDSPVDVPVEFGGSRGEQLSSYSAFNIDLILL